MNLAGGKKKLAEALLLPINPAAVIILGVYTIVWGLWLVSPFWTVFTQAALYSELAALAPECVWGALAIVAGSFTVYGSVNRSYKGLVRGAMASGWFWLIIAIFYFWGDVFNTGGITALTFALYAGFIYLNIRVNFKDDQSSPFILYPPKKFPRRRRKRE